MSKRQSKKAKVEASDTLEINVNDETISRRIKVCNWALTAHTNRLQALENERVQIVAMAQEADTELEAAIAEAVKVTGNEAAEYDWKQGGTDGRLLIGTPKDEDKL